jgi:heat shock protein HslJ
MGLGSGEKEEMMDIKRTILVGTTLVLAALLVACATATTDQPGAGGAVLPGTEWVLTSLTGRALIEDTRITLSFGEGSLEGSAGCNTYGGSYAATEDSLRLSDLYWTEMGCPEPEGILDQEMAYLNALNTVASYRLDADRLELYDEAGMQILVFGPR